MERQGGRGSYIQLSALRACGHVCRQVPRRGRGSTSSRHLYGEGLPGGGRASERLRSGKRARPDGTRSSGRRARVCDPLNAFMFHQRGELAGAYCCGRYGAQRDEPAHPPPRQSAVIFNCPNRFTERFSGADDFFKPNRRRRADRSIGLAMSRTNFVPDIVQHRGCRSIPRSTGYRRVESRDGQQPFMSGSASTRTGRYSKGAQAPIGGRARLRQRQGYTYTWTEALGTTPWKDGRDDRSCGRLRAVGLVSAATDGRREWFNQHFGIGKEGLRISAGYTLHITKSKLNCSRRRKRRTAPAS